MDGPSGFARSEAHSRPMYSHTVVFEDAVSTSYTVLDLILGYSQVIQTPEDMRKSNVLELPEIESQENVADNIKGHPGPCLKHGDENVSVI